MKSGQLFIEISPGRTPVQLSDEEKLEVSKLLKEFSLKVIKS